MMRWRLPGDETRPVISAEEHVRSAHAVGKPIELPEMCVVFEMGMAIPFIEKNWPTVTLAQELPCFIANSKCIAIEGRPGVCFVNGGYGAPAAADTLETVRALGAKRVLIVGMCGGFSPEIRVGDVVVPERILCEEGTSFHYYCDMRCAQPDAGLFRKAACWFEQKGRLWTAPTVTSDAFYRQTFAKEELWRGQGCIGVDMEASALLNVAGFYGMPAAAVLLCSDKHPLRDGGSGAMDADRQPEKWEWGDKDFRERRREFVRDAVELAFLI